MKPIDPQYTFDNNGQPVGVFLPIDDWNTIAEELHIDYPEWQKKMIDDRLDQYNKNPEDTLDWETISLQMHKEDETI